MRNVKYDFSSVHVDLPSDLAEEIIEWGKVQIPDASLFRDPKNPTLGREDELHVTILYGIHSAFPDQTFKLLRNENRINVRLGEVHIFKKADWFDVVTIAVEGADLERLNAKLRGNIRHSCRYKIYVPHITIAYVNKGESKGLEGMCKFGNRTFVGDTAVFSSKDSKRYSLKLKTAT